ncbi:hypothetical protein Q5P01_006570 [Channa striata]|uniref:BTB domain-containing protein n=1 Tax=Channa striata TaxID=64152 RepID=A0AA88T0X0_CHASR|nr:hypothetical protein Q5P01_006570 [Channa striata]
MAQTESQSSTFPEIVELNVGGQVYVTRLETVTAVPNSLLWAKFAQGSPGELPKDSKGRFFFDRDGFLFRYILDYLRDSELFLPEFFKERRRLQKEADFFQLPELSRRLAAVSKDSSYTEDSGDPEDAELALSPVTSSSDRTPRSPGADAGYITVGYRGSYTIGRDIQADAKFRRVARITVCSKISLAKGGFRGNPEREPRPGPTAGQVHVPVLPQVQLSGAGVRQAGGGGLPHGGVQLHRDLLVRQQRPGGGQTVDQLHRCVCCGVKGQGAAGICWSRFL